VTGGIAKRYARALLGVAKEQNRLEETSHELDSVVAWLTDAELAAALASPTLGTNARRALLGQLTEALHLSELTKNFLELLATRHRLDQVAAISQAYQSLADREMGRMRGTLRVARAIPDAALQEITTALEAVQHKQVLLSVEVDPSLLAGATLEIEGRVYDGSARTQLISVTRAMTRDGSIG
jgi:F-type H+-transporting ATPase subunit delta